MAKRFKKSEQIIIARKISLRRKIVERADTSPGQELDTLEYSTSPDAQTVSESKRAKMFCEEFYTPKIPEISIRYKNSCRLKTKKNSPNNSIFNFKQFTPKTKRSFDFSKAKTQKLPSVSKSLNLTKPPQSPRKKFLKRRMLTVKLN